MFGIAIPGALPHVLLWLDGWGAAWGVLRGRCVPSRLLEVVRVLPVLDFLHPYFALNQLIYVRHDHRPLDVHQRKRGRRLPV